MALPGILRILCEKGGLIVQKRLILCLLVVCVLLSGCGNLFDGHYSSVKPHEQQPNSSTSQNVSASNYGQLSAALVKFVQTGREKGVINVEDYNQAVVEADMKRAITDVMHHNAIAAYAVDMVSFELGKSRGKPALDVEIAYTHNRAEILKIKKVYDVSAVSMPANPDTSISARSYFDGVIEMEKQELLERQKEVEIAKLKFEF